MDKDILAEAKDAFAECVEAESDQRKRMLDDLRFARLGEQWPEKIKKAREEEGRPCLTINRQPAFIRQVVNDSRQNKPSIKVHPVDSGADLQTAKVYDGLIRNIEYTSCADVAYDTGIEHAASMGLGYWRINMDYARDDSFDLDLLIKRVSNPFAVYGDPKSTEADSSDWNTAFITELMSLARFNALYPDADEASWEGEHDAKDALWFEGEQIRVAEYWCRHEVERPLLLLSDGTTMLQEDFIKVDPETKLSAQMIAQGQGVTVVKQRMTKGYKVKQYLLTADECLDKKDWPGIYIPIVPVYGEEVNVEGIRHYFSLIHQSKDAQRMFNFWRTASTELVALAPKAPFIGVEGSFGVDTDKWISANVKSHPYIEYKDMGAGPPQRQPFAGPPAGALQEALNAADDMKAILGVYDASLGARSNETSGRAIMARQREGDVSTFHFIDNLTRAIRHTGRILIDLIPHVYNSERIVRVMGEDGTPQTVTINGQQPGPDGLMRRVNDVTAGKYDLTVASGPSFTTRREEAAYQMTEFVRAYPDSAPIIGDILVKNLDWPGAEEIAERLKAVNPVLQQQANAGQPPPPDPKMIEAEQKAALEEKKFGFEMQKSQAQLQQDREKSQAELMLEREIAAAQLALEREKVTAQLQLEQQKAVMQGQMKHEQEIMRLQQQDNHAKMIHEASAKPAVSVQVDGKEELQGMAQLVGEGITVVAHAAQTMAQGQETTANAAVMMAQAAQMMASAASAPKRIVRDEEGRPIGVEPVPTEPQ